jgi:hypothetical protein
MAKSKLVWTESDKATKANFSIPYVGQLNIEVKNNLPGEGSLQTREERKVLGLRHAQLLIRSLGNEIDRQARKASLTHLV